VCTVSACVVWTAEEGGERCEADRVVLGVLGALSRELLQVLTPCLPPRARPARHAPPRPARRAAALGGTGRGARRGVRGAVRAGSGACASDSSFVVCGERCVRSKAARRV